jgi:hypothetical protein
MKELCLAVLRPSSRQAVTRITARQWIEREKIFVLPKCPGLMDQGSRKPSLPSRSSAPWLQTKLPSKSCVAPAVSGRRSGYVDLV